MYAVRSLCGSDSAYKVGSGWFAGCTAKVSAVISTTVGWVGGRQSWEGPSSISVSLDGVWGSCWVLLVLGAIVQRKCESTKKQEKFEVDLMARFRYVNIDCMK
jgi:hypothetical protein